MVDAARERLDAVQHIDAQLKRSLARGEGLRRALLAAAFSGCLTGAPSDLSDAEEMIGV